MVKHVLMKKRPCFEDIAGFNDRWIIAAGLPVASILVSLLLFGEAYQSLDWRLCLRVFQCRCCIPPSFGLGCVGFTVNLRVATPQTTKSKNG
jgi:hypothetical protein